MDDIQAKIKSLEDRVLELEARLKIPEKLEPEQIRTKFLELMNSMDRRSLERLLPYLREETLAGSLLDASEELRDRVLAALSKTCRKEALEMMEILKKPKSRVQVVVDTDNVTLKHVEIAIVDFCLPYKVLVLEKVDSLERMGEVVLSGDGEHEIFV